MVLLPVQIDCAHSQSGINDFCGFALVSTTVNTLQRIPPGRQLCSKALFFFFFFADWEKQMRATFTLISNFLGMTYTHL